MYVPFWAVQFLLKYLSTLQMCDCTYIFSLLFFLLFTIVSFCSLSLCVCFALNVFCHLIEFATELRSFSFFQIFLFNRSSFLQVFCPLLLYPNHYGLCLCACVFQLESTNNVWSFHHQGCCHRVSMATSSPHSNIRCGQNGEAETESMYSRSHMNIHTQTRSSPPHTPHK